MTRIVLDRVILEKLHHMREHLEVCDETGQTLGFVTPASEPQVAPRGAVPFTRKELDSFKQKEGGRPLAEILGELRNQPSC